MDEKQERESLLREREGYARRGLPLRVKEVDKALRALGDDSDEIETTAVVPNVERAVKGRNKTKREI